MGILVLGVPLSLENNGIDVTKIMLHRNDPSLCRGTGDFVLATRTRGILVSVTVSF